MERGQEVVFATEFLPIFVLAAILATLKFRSRTFLIAAAFVALAPITEEFVFSVQGSMVTMAHLLAGIGICYVAYESIRTRTLPATSWGIRIFIIFLLTGVVSLMFGISTPATSGPASIANTPAQRGILELVRLTFSVAAGVFLIWAGFRRGGILQLMRIYAGAGAAYSAISIIWMLLVFANLVTQDVWRITIEYFYPGTGSPWRLTGFQFEPKNFAFYMSTSFAVTMYLWSRNERKLWNRVPLKALMLLQVASFVGAVSLASLAALAIGLVGFSIGLTISGGISTPYAVFRSWFRPALITSGTFVIILVAIPFVYADVGAFWGNQYGKLTRYEPEATGGIKLDRITADTNAAKENPITGVGVGKFPFVSDEFQDEDSAVTGFSGNQSFFTGVAAGQGLLGVAALLLMYVVLHRRILAKVKTGDGMFDATRVFAFSLLWMLIGILSLHDESRKMYVVVLVAFILLITRPENETADSDNVQPLADDQ
jgi:O-antigen ligase